MLKNIAKHPYLWFLRQSIGMLMLLLISLHFIDVFSAYVNFRVDEAFFVTYESNQRLVDALVNNSPFSWFALEIFFFLFFLFFVYVGHYRKNTSDEPALSMIRHLSFFFFLQSIIGSFFGTLSNIGWIIGINISFFFGNLGWHLNNNFIPLLVCFVCVFDFIKVLKSSNIKISGEKRN